MEFLDYIENLAPEGETALIVRQKPILADGQLQFHPDGAIKCTWPAYLPKQKRKAGESWYGNTASFIKDRFKDGRPSASAANCEYILVMVLDDVGDPLKAPNRSPLAPTWIIETSAGSFQWGYAFSEQPSKVDFAAAIRAIADAGYTDPGACNPVRNFRLPGSINLKPGKNNFAAQLIEFHPEREYTLDEICAALDVTPVAGVGLGPTPIRLQDDGNDDVMAWLSDKGLLLRHTNPEGWAGVVCPNHGEHTDGNPEGRYHPANRAYCCLHSHCIDLTSSTFLDWVATNGGPQHAPGPREELLAAIMTTALAKLPDSGMFEDTAAKVVQATDARSKRREMVQLEKSDWYERFAYVQEDESFFDMCDRREISRSTFNALFRHIPCRSIHNGSKIEASTCFDENRQLEGAHALVGITYAAGEEVIVEREGHTYGNRWRDARPAGVPGDVTRWLSHVTRMIPNDFEREHFLNALAFKVQHPNRKINHAILIGGHPGSGKDTMMAPFFWAIGGKSKQNCSLVKNEDLSSQWGYALECEVMEIAELRQSEARDRRALENALKPIIAAPPELLQVNRKGLHPYMALNRVFVVAFSNERAAISIPSDDRRWFCLWAEAGRLPEADALALWRWYDAGGFQAVASWLHTRDVSAFNPSAAPPMTEAKAIMIDQGRSTAESYLIDLIQHRLGEFAVGVIASPFFALCDRLAGAAPSGTKVPQVALLHALKEAGWVDIGRVATRELTTKKQLYCAPELATLSKAELRRLAEDVPAPAAVRLVK
jgi:hypothetical protein